MSDRPWMDSVKVGEVDYRGGVAVPDYAYWVVRECETEWRGKLRRFRWPEPDFIQEIGPDGKVIQMFTSCSGVQSDQGQSDEEFYRNRLQFEPLANRLWALVGDEPRLRPEPGKVV